MKNGWLTLKFANLLFPKDYEAMESFVPGSEDEIGFEAGEKVKVLHKKMDGWWKIRCGQYAHQIGSPELFLVHFCHFFYICCMCAFHSGSFR